MAAGGNVDETTGGNEDDCSGAGGSTYTCIGGIGTMATSPVAPRSRTTQTMQPRIKTNAVKMRLNRDFKRTSRS
jgi:hypothetical protein